MPEITGYRDLTPEEVEAVNQLKQQANVIGVSVEALELGAGIDKRWVAIGKTHLQQGFMALIRSITQPKGF